MRHFFSEDISPYSFVGLVCNKELPSPRTQTIGLAVNFTIVAAMLLAIVSATADGPRANEHSRYAAVERIAVNS